MEEKYNLSANGINQLRANYEGFDLYMAGLPSFPNNFSRDGIISGLLTQDPEMLKNQLSFCAHKQGTKKNPLTGEEPGKIHHEYPGFKMPNGLYTTYNACDTNALYLIGHYFYQKLTKDYNLAEEQKENINQATKYILRHINENGFFIEDPKEFCGGDKFALKVTYWKDSCIINRDNGIPVYPVTYTLPLIQNIDGLKKAQILFDWTELSGPISKMSDALQKLYDEKLGTYYLAKDKKGPIKGISSDPLQAFYYLDPGDIPENKLNQIAESSAVLETSIGYRTLDSRLLSKESDEESNYHSRTIWPVEQAMINYGANKLGIERPKNISYRITSNENTSSETFTIDDEGIVKEGGCNPQLWSIAAGEYFKSSHNSY